MLGGLGSTVMELAKETGYLGRIKKLGIPDKFIPHGSPGELHRLCGFDTHSIIREVRSILAS